MKNKKILIIALFLILFCLFGCSKCFASVSYTYNGNKITLPEIPEKEGYINYLIYYANDNPNIVQLKLFPTDLSYYPTVYKPNGCLSLNTYSNTSISAAPSYFYDVEKGADEIKNFLCYPNLRKGSWGLVQFSGDLFLFIPTSASNCTNDVSVARYRFPITRKLRKNV